jgi:hypothetical protein
MSMSGFGDLVLTVIPPKKGAVPPVARTERFVTPARARRTARTLFEEGAAALG